MTGRIDEPRRAATIRTRRRVATRRCRTDFRVIFWGVRQRRRSLGCSHVRAAVDREGSSSAEAPSHPQHPSDPVTALNSTPQVHTPTRTKRRPTRGDSPRLLTCLRAEKWMKPGYFLSLDRSHTAAPKFSCISVGAAVRTREVDESKRN